MINKTSLSIRIHYIRINFYGGNGLEFISSRRKRNDKIFPKLKEELVLIFLKWVIVEMK